MWYNCILCFEVIWEFVRGELTSSKKMKLGWESVQVSRLWSATKEAPSQPAVGTKLKVTGDNLVYLFMFVPEHLCFCLHAISLHFQSFCSQRAFLLCSIMFESMIFGKPAWLSFQHCLFPYNVASPITLPDFVSCNPQMSSISPFT